LRKFDSFLTGDRGHQLIENNIHKALEIKKELVDQALEETYNEKKSAAQAKHLQNLQSACPCLYAYTEKHIPGSIFFVAVSGIFKSKYVFLDKAFLNLPNAERLKAIKEEIEKHFAKMEGKITSFGNITHYTLLDDPSGDDEERQSFDTEGNEIELPADRKRFPIINAYCRV